MSNKRFTVIDTRTNSTKQWDSNATTLGELKAELNSLNISTVGMAIQEGLTNIELINDSSLLPHDVPYKGTVTNNLVFRLTKAEKFIDSGNDSDPDPIDIINKVKEFFKDLKEKVEKSEKCEKCDNNTPIEIKTAKAVNILVNDLYDNDYIDEDTYRQIANLFKGESLEKVDSPYSAEELHDMFANM